MRVSKEDKPAKGHKQTKINLALLMPFCRLILLKLRTLGTIC